MLQKLSTLHVNKHNIKHKYNIIVNSSNYLLRIYMKHRYKLLSRINVKQLYKYKIYTTNYITDISSGNFYYLKKCGICIRANDTVNADQAEEIDRVIQAKRDVQTVMDTMRTKHTVKTSQFLLWFTRSRNVFQFCLCAQENCIFSVLRRNETSAAWAHHGAAPITTKNEYA